MTTFVSLYQAGEGIYDQFDKVLLIDEGRQVYFGPAREARAYMVSLGFEDLPRQTSADYLTGCTGTSPFPFLSTLPPLTTPQTEDPNERHLAPGIDPATVPTSPERLAEAYRASSTFEAMKAERAAFVKEIAEESKAQDDFAAAVREDKRKGVGEKSPYTVSIFTQVQALIIRQ